MEKQTEKRRSQYDTTLKDLFAQPPQRLLQMLIGRQAIQLLPVEFASTQKRFPDLLFLLDDGAIFHLELQGTPEGMDWRMLMYYVLIRQRYPDKVLRQTVLYVGQAPWHPPSVILEKNLSFRYDVVDIRMIDCRALLNSPALEESILAVLCRMDDHGQTIRTILGRIALLPTKARADALAKLVILSSLRQLETLVKTEAEEMTLTFDVMENDVLRPLFVKAQRDGEQRGIRIGEQKGRQEGEAVFLLRLLQRRFGTLPDRVIQQVHNADPSTLERWGDQVLDAQSLDGVFAERV
ncbi:MAG: DUF4351 domain-containing protein [Magnetococcus sp. DMHC-8]